MHAPVSLIWAMTRNRVIGRDNQLPWQLKTDMQFFIDTTRGKPVIMGRKQFESMPRALPGRLNIVMSRKADYRLDGAIVVETLEQAISVARESMQAPAFVQKLALEKVSAAEVMIIGGAEIYALALPIADRLYMTEIHAEIVGDTFFPEFELDQWREISRTEYQQDALNDFDFTIRILDRKK